MYLCVYIHTFSVFVWVQANGFYGLSISVQAMAMNGLKFLPFRHLRKLVNFYFLNKKVYDIFGNIIFEGIS